MRRSLPYALIAVAWFARSTAFSASIDFDVQPRVLRVDETATCTITVNDSANAPAPSLPPIQGFDVMSSGREQSFTIDNGRQNSSTTYRFQLVPKAVGKFSIGPFQYNTGQETIDLPAVQVEVTAPGSTQAQGQPAQWSDLLFAKLTTDRPSVYHQETFDLTLAIYYRGINIDRTVGLLNMPTTGISLQPFQELSSSREAINNEIYEVRRFRCKAVALTAGTFTLNPTLRVTQLIRRDRNRDPLFGDIPGFEAFFGGGYEAHPVDVTTQPLELSVQTLPTEGRPSNFSGAVGRFSFDASIQPSEINVGEPINLTMRIEGEGNIDAVAAPQIVLGDGFKIYEPKLVTREIDEQHSSGRKIFEQVVIPRSTDAKSLPVIPFVYFDPRSEKYETIARGPFALTLREGNKESLKVVQGGGKPLEAKTEVLGTDIVYLKPAPSTWINVNKRPWYESRTFLSLQAAPPIALAIILLAVRRREVFAKDIVKARRHLAPRSARSSLARAQQALAANNRTAFYEAIWSAMADYFGNRLNLQPGQISKDLVLNSLRAGGLAPALLDELSAAFEKCEQVRFGAIRQSNEALTSEESEQCRHMIGRLGEILRTCEKIRL